MIGQKVSARFWPVLLVPKLGGNDRLRCKATFRKDISSITQTRFSSLNSWEYAPHALRRAAPHWKAMLCPLRRR